MIDCSVTASITLVIVWARAASIRVARSSSSARVCTWVSRAARWPCRRSTSAACVASRRVVSLTARPPRPTTNGPSSSAPGRAWAAAVAGLRAAGRSSDGRRAGGGDEDPAPSGAGDQRQQRPEEQEEHGRRAAAGRQQSDGAQVGERDQQRAVGAGGGADDEPGHQRGEERGREARPGPVHRRRRAARRSPSRTAAPANMAVDGRRPLEHRAARDGRGEALPQADARRRTVQDRGAHLDGGHAGCRAVSALTWWTRAETWNGLAR